MAFISVILDPLLPETMLQPVHPITGALMLEVQQWREQMAALRASLDDPAQQAAIEALDRQMTERFSMKELPYFGKRPMADEHGRPLLRDGKPVEVMACNPKTWDRVPLEGRLNCEVVRVLHGDPA